MKRTPSLLACAGALTLLSQPAAADGHLEDYVFDKGHTDIEFYWNHFGFSTTSAEFESFSGNLMFDEEDPTNSEVSVTIDMASVDSGFETFNDHLREKEEWFNVAEYPEATFESSEIARKGDQRYAVTGDLTLKGVTREVTLDAKINKIGMHPISEAKTIGFDAETTVKRSNFNLGKYAPNVGDEVTIEISSEMQREADL